MTPYERRLQLAAALLSGLWDGANLLHHAQGIIYVPIFYYLATFDAADSDPHKLNPLTAWGDVHQVALVSSAHRPATYHRVPFGYLVLYGYLYVGEGTEYHVVILFSALNTVYVLGHGRVVVDVVRSVNLVHHVHVAPVDDVVSETAG